MGQAADTEGTGQNMLMDLRWLSEQLPSVSAER